MAKYNNTKCEVDGIKFDSKHEMNIYQELLLQKKAQDPKDRVVYIELQPKFKIHNAYELHGKKVRAIFYIADFKVGFADGRVEIIDAKGVETDVFKIKRKLFEKMYNREIIIR